MNELNDKEILTFHLFRDPVYIFILNESRKTLKRIRKSVIHEVKVLCCTTEFIFTLVERRITSLKHDSVHTFRLEDTTESLGEGSSQQGVIGIPPHLGCNHTTHSFLCMNVKIDHICENKTNYRIILLQKLAPNFEAAKNLSYNLL